MPSTNHHFWIGTNHTVCEDYAISGITPYGTPYAVVCDGCSSSPDTDFGARILARAAVRHIQQLPSTEVFAYSVISEMETMLRAVDMPLHSGDATLLVAAVINEKLYVNCFGDGALAFVYDDGYLAIDYEYPSGAPFYLNYRNDKRRMAQYMENYGTEVVSRHVSTVCEDKWLVTEAGQGIFNSGVQRYAPDVGLHGLKGVVLMSDGIKTFSDPDQGNTYTTRSVVDWREIIDEVLSFKTFKGDFVLRRCSRMMKNYNKVGRSNSDDVSVAAIFLDNNDG